MSVAIRMYGDPVLSAVCEEATWAEALSACALMRTALRESKIGVGLAAPQVGIAKRVVVIWHMRKGGESISMANPEIVARSEKTVSGREGCLSRPGVYADVTRHEWVECVWTDPDLWTPQRRIFNGFQARVVQHELAHLDGKCAIFAA